MRRPDRGRRRRAGRLSRCTPASHAPTKQRTSSGIRSLLPTNRNCSSELPLSSAAYIDLVGARTPSYRYWFERLARLPVEAHLASEFHYREAPLRPGDAAAFVSQSGEAADPPRRCTTPASRGSTSSQSSIGVNDRPRERCRHPDTGGPGDRGSFDQGVYVPVSRSCPCVCPRWRRSSRRSSTRFPCS